MQKNISPRPESKSAHGAADFCKLRLGPDICQSTVCPGTLPFAPDVRYIRYLSTAAGRGRQDFATVDENLAG